ncbi:MAG: menaquinone biosynthesis protein [Thermoleophilia bacterium]|nr:menaquinone biosynthesis protein [Thermoleophilia bacterium]
MRTEADKARRPAAGADGAGAGEGTPGSAAVRIGHFEFLNGYPLYYGLERGQGWGCFDLVHGVPTKLNGLLLAGGLDISPISSIEYAAHADGLLLFPRLSITSDGTVDSIQLICRRPIENIETVAVTGQSATSVVLLKILLRQGYGLAPEFTGLAGGVAEALRERDAVLLIGDQALDACYRGGWERAYDLGSEWKELTGLPMVFALWAVRRPFYRARPDETREVQERLLYSVDYCRGHWEEVVTAASGAYPFEPDMLRAYFSKLRYDFTGEFRQGLEEFYRRAVQIGEAGGVPRLEFI